MEQSRFYKCLQGSRIRLREGRRRFLRPFHPVYGDFVSYPLVLVSRLRILQLYFPDDHKFAIYVPYFVPVLLPIFMGLVREVLTSVKFSSRF
mmetsp:Transcript_5355/g.12528  ORF Transcript_5355/g.12528 Transcript_5355/m.12528 type:complete len:92 (+) Transcript_5355:692-967(+)